MENQIHNFNPKVLIVEHFDEKIAKTLGISNLSDFNFEDNINSID